MSNAIFRPRQVMIALCLMAAFLGNASASPKTVTVEGQTGRPVAEAILWLEKRYSWQITYEDPPYVHYSDIVDVTNIDRPGVPTRSEAAEARVARSLAAGETVTDIASAGGVSRNTILTQLRGVMGKTGCNRQADVVALLTAISPARLTHPA